MLLSICSCINTTERGKSRTTVPVQWQYLTLEFNDTIIQVAQPIDTIVVTTFKGGMEKYPIRHSEKDSLIAWSHQLIDVQGQPRKFCTDYVGKFKVRIRYSSQLQKEVSFTSICDWRQIDSNANKIDQLLSQVIKFKSKRTTVDS